MCALPLERHPRCTASERRRRIAELQDAAALGEDLAAAARRLCASWGITSRRNARRYAAAALASWARDRRVSSRGALAAATAMRRTLFRSAFGSGDFGAAARVLDGLERLLGVEPPERREVLISTFDVVAADLVEVMRREIVDPLPPALELTRRLARGFRVAMEAGARRHAPGVNGRALPR